jgi:hypothetical protein
LNKSDDEIRVLNRGLRFNLHTEPKDMRKNFASEAETVRSHLTAIEQECTR